jgi:hypothetical protein
MIECINTKVACQECAAEVIISFEDLYGPQYVIAFCPFCGEPDPITEEVTTNEEF